MNKKIMEIELAAENQSFMDGYYYADLLLPAEEHEIRDALQRVRGVGRNENDTDISILNCEYLPQLNDVRIDGLTLKELNFFANRLAELDENEVAVLKAVAPHYLPDAGDTMDMKTLINLTYGLDNVPVISGVFSDEQLGEFAIDNDLNDDVAEIPESSLYLLDKAQIGKLQREADGGVFVGNNYVKDFCNSLAEEKIEWSEEYEQLKRYPQKLTEQMAAKLSGCITKLKNMSPGNVSEIQERTLEIARCALSFTVIRDRQFGVKLMESWYTDAMAEMYKPNHDRSGYANRISEMERNLQDVIREYPADRVLTKSEAAKQIQNILEIGLDAVRLNAFVSLQEQAQTEAIEQTM